MENIFQYIFQMSFYGSIAILAVLILRKCFSKLPKKVTVLFWLVPGIRLICPLNLSSIFSVMNVVKMPHETDGKMGEMANAVLPALGARPLPSPTDISQVPATSDNLTGLSAATPMMVVTLIWLAGMVLMLSYLAIKTIILLNALRSAKRVRGKRYYVSDAIDTSFVLGILRPRIYMQAGLSEKEESFILLHERTHIKYMDHITRIVGVLTLCLHWFNPLVWIAFSRLCADLEMRCDETVVEQMGSKIRMDYCKSIVNHALERDATSRGLSVAFSGNNFRGREVKMRVRNLINYKKVSTIAAIAIAVAALGLTAAISTRAQAEEKEPSVEVTEASSVFEPVQTEGTEKVGAPVSVPGNLALEMTEEESLETYGKENLELPADVQYSDEGRPFSKTYDFRTTPTLKKLADICEKAGFKVENEETEYLDKDGNVQTGRELYHFSASKENGNEVMFLYFYMVSEDYANESFNEKEVRDGLWIYNPAEAGPWCVSRIYDTRTGVMLDANGTYKFDWESLGLFDTTSSK
ncbi:hypothetical protein D6855_10895 [Butyrivibrio sp. CB08]|uniref:M56 family metallopeptidase n=1 Tax=Butyrivibrio sp. CB08 TaxID=2364879 RepID=UPI000EA8B0A0|nr:M56 family metallopeptidase [Butyrivibrio sp. CB08]RKM59396.1 hypothetical protein D6855_10895 [Butyrivibrio sp. CB08]